MHSLRHQHTHHTDSRKTAWRVQNGMIIQPTPIWKPSKYQDAEEDVSSVKYKKHQKTIFIPVNDFKGEPVIWSFDVCLIPRSLALGSEKKRLDFYMLLVMLTFKTISRNANLYAIIENNWRIDGNNDINFSFIIW